MKFLSVHLTAFVALLPLFGQELIRDPSTGASDATIPVPISDGTQLPAPLPVLPNFKIKSTVVLEVDVIEPPPMVGLPPVTGTITETVHLVEDPKLPDPVAPIALPQGAGTSQVPSRTPTPSRMLAVSATVYDHSRTLLRFHTRGNPAGEITVWSNLDFNDFGGFTSFEVNTASGTLRRYQLMLSLKNEDTQARAAFLAGYGEEYQAPVIPTLADGAPAYQIVGGSPDQECRDMIADLHHLYQDEGPRMKAAYLARLKAEEDRRAYLLVHPPAPKDVTIHFWEREHPVGMSADTIKKSGGN